MSSLNSVKIKEIKEYDSDQIFKSLDDSYFSLVKPGNTVVLKPNWVRESHQSKLNDWDYVITHHSIITSVLKKVIGFLNGAGKIIITDGPETSASFDKIISHYPVSLWFDMIKGTSIDFSIIDLREDEWMSDGNVVVQRRKLPGDPKGSVEINLKNNESEFHLHNKSIKGYFGADSDIGETNRAHDGVNNLYRVSRSVIEADVFINLPKLKTHKKGGITCCLKNLVGINTYKNFLPHCSIGTPDAGGDQFPLKKASSSIESKIMPFLHQRLLIYPGISKVVSPFISIAKKLFGNNDRTIRGGSWHGNDTLWRMVIDLNKILFYGSSDNIMKVDNWLNAKKYIGIVDAIKAGEGNGPKSPDMVNMGYLLIGLNPVAIDAVAAVLMGFDPQKIPAIKNAFNVVKYSICKFSYNDIKVEIGDSIFCIDEIPLEYKHKFKPHFGWIGKIEQNY